MFDIDVIEYIRSKKHQLLSKKLIQGIPIRISVNRNNKPNMAPSNQNVLDGMYPNPYHIGAGPIPYGVNIPIRPTAYNKR